MCLTSRPVMHCGYFLRLHYSIMIIILLLLLSRSAAKPYLIKSNKIKTVCSTHLIIKLLGTEGELHIPIVARYFFSVHLKGNKICQEYFYTYRRHYSWQEVLTCFP